ncbi:MAG TPA: hypothetical protein VKR27_07180 [Acidimicrobiales bacterium]|nr:hypothetical protein [Acidimicrobiales bacterium]
MASNEELENAIGNRLLQQLEQGATSETILKLAEALAWVRSPDQPHGGFSTG